jgi:hypothetical protein
VRIELPLPPPVWGARRPARALPPRLDRPSFFNEPRPKGAVTKTTDTFFATCASSCPSLPLFGGGHHGRLELFLRGWTGHSFFNEPRPKGAVKNLESATRALNPRTIGVVKRGRRQKVPSARPVSRRHTGLPPRHCPGHSTTAYFRGEPSVFDPAHPCPCGSECGSHRT